MLGHLIRIWDRRQIRKFQSRILRWYDRHQRALPWRSSPSPYRVWISEIMLQQTQVKTVLPYYDRFLKRFPDVHSLAAASEDEVLAHWAGLGYYSRARNLHRAANMIVREFDGEFPDTTEEIRQLPGVGRYTLGAILSIAFNRPEPIVDGNVRRIITRLHGLDRRVPESFFWEQASAWADESRPSDFSQAVMELGALICTPANPQCHSCPVWSLCAGSREGIQDRIPVRRQNRPVEEVGLVVLVLKQWNSILLSKNLPASFIPGPWGLPSRLMQPGETPEAAVQALCRKMRLKRIALRRTGAVRHGITYRRMTAVVYEAERDERTAVPEEDRLRWVEPAESERLLTSSLYRKALACCEPAVFRNSTSGKNS